MTDDVWLMSAGIPTAAIWQETYETEYVQSNLIWLLFRPRALRPGHFFIESSLKYWYIKNVESTRCF